MLKSNIGVIGAGNMASSIIRGILKNELLNPKDIYVYDIDNRKKLELTNDTSTIALDDNHSIMKNSRIIILAVKPNSFGELLDEISDDITDEHILISIAAGISTDYIKEKTSYKCKVVRIMPNTPALVGEGMTAICMNRDLDDSERKIINSIFSSLGRVEEVDEELINGVTAISGSSPAYVYLFIEALADGGVMMGLPREQSYRMAAQSVLGAAKMVLELGKHPGELKDMVCSPKGTTIEAIYTLEKNNFRGSIMEAMKNCALKSQEMDAKM